MLAIVQHLMHILQVHREADEILENPDEVLDYIMADYDPVPAVEDIEFSEEEAELSEAELSREE